MKIEVTSLTFLYCPQILLFKTEFKETTPPYRLPHQGEIFLSVITVLSKNQHKEDFQRYPSEIQNYSLFFFLIPIIITVNTGRRHGRSFRGTDNVLFPDLGAGYTGVFILQKFTELYP